MNRKPINIDTVGKDWLIDRNESFISKEHEDIVVIEIKVNALYIDVRGWGSTNNIPLISINTNDNEYKFDISDENVNYIDIIFPDYDDWWVTGYKNGTRSLTVVLTKCGT